MANCNKKGCECCTCKECGEYYYNCRCELIADTTRLLGKDDYTYEDFAHSARYLLERWLSSAK